MDPYQSFKAEMIDNDEMGKTGNVHEYHIDVKVEEHPIEVELKQDIELNSKVPYSDNSHNISCSTVKATGTIQTPSKCQTSVASSSQNLKGVSENKITEVGVCDKALSGNIRNISHPCSCSQCDKAFRYLGELMRRHGEDLPYQCSHCHKSFKYVYDLTHHIKNIHPDPGTPYQPSQCDKALSRNIGNAGGKPHTCSQCDKAFCNRGELNAHVKLSHNLLHCTQCSSTFHGYIALKQHMKVHHYETIVRPTGTIQTQSNCQKNVASSSQNLKGVSENKITEVGLGNKAFSGNIKNKPHQCTQCDKAFRFLGELNAHLRLFHYGTHICTQCCISFLDETALRKHKQMFKCKSSIASAPGIIQTPSKCKKIVVPGSQNIKGGAVENMVRDTPKQCRHCDKAFVHRPELDGNLKSSNYGSQYCTQCGITFLASIDPNKYMQMHKSKSSIATASGTIQTLSKRQKTEVSGSKNLRNMSLEKITDEDFICIQSYSFEENMSKEFIRTGADNLSEPKVEVKEEQLDSDINELDYLREPKIEVKEEQLDSEINEMDYLWEPIVEVKEEQLDSEIN